MRALIRLLSLLVATAPLALGPDRGALAQNSFGTPGGATVPGYVTMCIVTGVAVPCSPSTAPLQQPLTLYSAAGTPLPTCNFGTNGATATVSDTTAPTYRSAYTSGGTITGRVLCVNGTGWVND
jgi:hypothetical protein